MARTHAQQFANETLLHAVYADPLAFMRTIASDDAPRMFAALWEQAGAELAPIARIPGTAITTRITRRDLFITAVITPAIPRATEDAALIAIVGRGDGAHKMSTLAYYVLELVLDAATGAPRFKLVSRTRQGAIETTWRDGPLPDPSWLVDHVFEVYSGRVLQPHAGVPELPSWYWWYALSGADATRLFAEATTDDKRFEVIKQTPMLLLPEIADVNELLGDAAQARRLRELRRFVHGAAWEAAIERLASTSTGSVPANVIRAIALIDDAVRTRVVSRQRADELESTLRAKLAMLGIDANANIVLAEQLAASARTPRIARGSAAPPIAAEDPMWRPLFLDDADLPLCARSEPTEWSEPTFLAHGGVRAGSITWRGDDRSALAQVVDARLVFRTAAGAAAFIAAVAPALGDGLPAVAVPALGDDTLAFGGDHIQIVVVRIGRVVARLHVQEGAYAASARQILHTATLHP